MHELLDPYAVNAVASSTRGRITEVAEAASPGPRGGGEAVKRGLTVYFRTRGKFCLDAYPMAMKVPSLSSATPRTGGFTLIELLVVIAIIAVLAALSLPVFATVQNYSRKAQVASDRRAISVAIISYYNDYRKYPLNQNQLAAVTNLSEDAVYGDPGGSYPNADLFDILRAQADGYFNLNNQLNPSQTVYWSGPLVKNPAIPRNGITTVDFMDGNNSVRAGSLVDPWGNPYVIWIDANKDGDLSNAIGRFYRNIAPNSVRPGLPPMGFEIGSLGPDGQFGTKGNGILAGSDDTVSW